MEIVYMHPWVLAVLTLGVGMVVVALIINLRFIPSHLIPSTIGSIGFLCVLIAVILSLVLTPTDATCLNQTKNAASETWEQAKRFGCPHLPWCAPQKK